MELSFEQREDIGLKYVFDLLEPVSPYGLKRLRGEGFYGPGDREALERELDNVGLLLTALKRDRDGVEALRHELSCLKDLGGTLTHCEDGPLSEVELFELTGFCLRMRRLIPMAEALPGYDRLEGIRFAPIEGALEILDPARSGRLSFFVEDARSPELLRARTEKRETEKLLRRPGADREALTARRLAAVREEERALVAIHGEMSAALRPLLPALRQDAEAAGRLDAAIAKALLSTRCRSCRPEVGGDTLRLSGAVNPRIADALEARGRRFTPIDVEMPRGVTVLTGANMGGKSVAIKTITLNLCLALLGCYVFCEGAEVPLFDRIELINRDFSNAEGGLSSFGGEILRFNEALAGMDRGGLSFIAMDEFARGTNAIEGAAIARGVVRYLAGKNAVTILATHYDGTAEFSARHYQVRGLRELREKGGEEAPSLPADALRSIENAMDYGLIPVAPGAECPRDALRICRILGMKPEILEEIEA
ncbi:MAG: hypothetical protein IJ705_02045 [Oscillospiraceae bacterium]|nr:hypothetical protein [Oscillospiraceae bacterium]